MCNSGIFGKRRIIVYEAWTVNVLYCLIKLNNHVDQPKFKEDSPKSGVRFAKKKKKKPEQVIESFVKRF